ncbi:MAG: nucleotidyltransferase family protein [Synechococcaceae cyanobacterium]
MEAIILAGGFGKRLRELVPDVPKPMAPVAGKPFLEILLTSLAEKGFHRAILSVGFRADHISSHFGEFFAGIKLSYEVEEYPLGTGGAVRAALQQCRNNHVYIFNGDTYLDLEVERLEQHWQERGNPVIVCRAVPDVSRYGALDIKDGAVVRFLEKGGAGAGIINAGCYILPVNMLDSYQVGKPFALEADFLAQAVTQQRFDIFESHGVFIDIGVPADYSRAQILLEGR